MKQSFAPKPTEYRGIQMRSRLEAKWAAFFDEIGWRWEYEPDGFGNYYIPDFMVLGPSPMLVEVRPVATLEQYKEQMYSMRVDSDLWKHDLFVAGSSPLSWYSERETMSGLIGQWEMGGTQKWGFSPGMWSLCKNCGEVAVTSLYMSSAHSPCGCYEEDDYINPEGAIPMVQRAWSNAVNAMKWMPS
jgi:hypothetical protein